MIHIGKGCFREQTDVLQVKTFGGFSLTWKGKTLGQRSSESQFVYLMQVLLHEREKGISRNQMEEILFEDRDIANVHHAMQSVIYNAKKRLRAAGLPDVNYIEFRKGNFYWTDKIPIEEDARRFDLLYRQGEEAESMEEKLALYTEACHCYTGEFLPNQAGMLWAAQEARRYRGQFCACVEKAVALMKESESWQQMEELGIYAAMVQPLSDWEAVTMEALLELGHYEEARKLYDNTEKLYLQEQGLRPSKRLVDMLDKLGSLIEHQYESLNNIQKSLSGLSSMKPGGYMCSYPVFQGIYRMVERMMERGGQSVYLMMCTVVDGKGNPMKEGPMLDSLSQRLGDSIQRSVRHSDAINRYSKGQYLVLLVNTTLEDCKIIQKRINQHFIVGRQRTGVQYYVNSVICMPGTNQKPVLIPGTEL